ncbi:MAG: hypothetical protein Q4G16_08730, partial [Cruoricaptor ignavus]|nr:hypothetical protein [Cruoricaptor ignavus]
KYGNHIDFYFIGITNKESLVEDLMEEVGFNSNLYIIDKEISPNDLVNRKKKFNKDFIFLLKKRKTDFITGYINRKLSKINLNNSIKVNEQKLKRKIKKYNVENHL